MPMELIYKTTLLITEVASWSAFSHLEENEWGGMEWYRMKGIKQEDMQDSPVSCLLSITA